MTQSVTLHGREKKRCHGCDDVMGIEKNKNRSELPAAIDTNDAIILVE